METNEAIKMRPSNAQDFRTYLENSLRNPFTLDLSGLSLMEVIRACIRAKSKRHPGYGKNASCLVYNLALLEEQYRLSLMPVQVTDVFWGYFSDFCQSHGLKQSTILTVCNQLRSVLSWAVKYNATVSPTYTDIGIRKPHSQEIALSADDVSRITYFDIDRFYAGRRRDFRDTLRRVRDMFVLSCNLAQRHSDMVRIGPECFERNVFRIVQQKTGSLAVVDIDKYAIEAGQTYRILEEYGYEAPYKGDISNYNSRLHRLMKDVGLDEPVRLEERVNGRLVTRTAPRWQLIASHTALRTFVTVNVMRGVNVHALKRCTGHTDLRVFDSYIRDDIQNK